MVTVDLNRLEKTLQGDFFAQDGSELVVKTSYLAVGDLKTKLPNLQGHGAGVPDRVK